MLNVVMPAVAHGSDAAAHPPPPHGTRLCREMRDSNIAISNRPFGGDAGEAGRTNGGVVVVNYNGQFTLR